MSFGATVRMTPHYKDLLLMIMQLLDDEDLNSDCF